MTSIEKRAPFAAAGKKRFPNGDTYEGLWKGGQASGPGLYKARQGAPADVCPTPCRTRQLPWLLCPSQRASVPSPRHLLRILLTAPRRPLSPLRSGPTATSTTGSGSLARCAGGAPLSG